MRTRTRLFAVLTVMMILGANTMMAETARAEPVVLERIVLDKIWSAVRVGFSLLTEEDRQYVAYYNADRRMVVGMRKLGEDSFTTMMLPSEMDGPPNRGNKTSTVQGWDSHNYITMVLDADGYIHLAGNMHVDPLTYFRSTEPYDITTLEQVKSMTGKQENQVTYPRFVQTPQGRLVFRYRHGGSGRGDEVYNIYDEGTRTWSRLSDSPLLSGEGRRNAYPNGPTLGPDGYYHMLWVWRQTFRAETCHDLSYARSRDLVNWENAAGERLAWPIVLSSPGTIVDPIPIEGGIINGCQRFGFDSQDRIVVTYHKHDENGNTQAYAARFADGAWKIRAISNWEGKHIFRGGGSGPSTFGTSIGLGTIAQHGPGKLALPYRHWIAERGLLVVDEGTLEPLGTEPQQAQAPVYPATLTKVQSDFPGMGIRWAHDLGKPAQTGVRYVLRWETLGTNRDRPREGKLPENAELVLYKIASSE